MASDQAAEDRRTQRHNPPNWQLGLLVRDAHSAAESVPQISVCVAIYGVTPHVLINNTASSTNVIIDLDGLLKQASIDHSFCMTLISVSTSAWL